MHPTHSTQQRSQSVAMPLHSMQTRGKDGIVVPKRYFNLSATTPLSPLPHTYRQALKDPNWQNAMTDEYNALMNNNTWCLVPKPAGVNVVTGKWIFCYKYNSDGSLSRYKARWVVRGCSQKPGVDYGETFSLVIKPATIRTVLSIATSSNWPIHQLDVKNAFLHGNLSETVYCAQPSGFVDASKPSHVCKLNKSLYGLKQAPRTWFLRFQAFLSSIGYHASKADSSLFILHTPTATSYILLYVDDIILTASSTTLLNLVISKLHSEFAMKDLGPLSHFLGIHVTPTPSGLFLSQEQYIHDLLDRAHMLNCNPCTTLSDTKPKLSSTHGPSVANATEFRSLAGTLQYLTITRPDISYAVQQICLFMHDPKEPHLHLLKRVLRYLKGTMTYGLHITKSSSLDITAYSDADWAGCPDTRRSTSGYCVFLGDNLVAWSSKRQPTVSRSSAEAEYRAVANAVSETCWLRQLLGELRRPLKKATLVFCDNISAQYLATNPVQHQRTKHIEIDLHFVRDKVALGEVKVLHVPSNSQFADIFTKGLPRVLHEEFRRSLHIVPRPG
jgi:histone deacetylase 1/2